LARESGEKKAQKGTTLTQPKDSQELTPPRGLKRERENACMVDPGKWKSRAKREKKVKWNEHKSNPRFVPGHWD